MENPQYQFKIIASNYELNCVDKETLDKGLAIIKNLDLEKDMIIHIYSIKAGKKTLIEKIERKAKKIDYLECPACGEELEFDKKLNEYICPECDYRADDMN